MTPEHVIELAKIAIVTWPCDCPSEALAPRDGCPAHTLGPRLTSGLTQALEDQRALDQAIDQMSLGRRMRPLPAPHGRALRRMRRLLARRRMRTRLRRQRAAPLLDGARAMNPRTQAYERYGLHAIRDLDAKAAWVKHLRGETVRLYDLPTNGDHCTEGTIGGAVCGFPILIDGACPNAPEHGEVEVEVTDEMVDAAYAALPGWVANEVESQLMRAAIEAALRVQEAGS